MNKRYRLGEIEEAVSEMEELIEESACHPATVV